METVVRVAAQRRRITLEPAEFCGVINGTFFFLNSCAVSYFVNINAASTPVLVHTLRRDACTESHRTFACGRKIMHAFLQRKFKSLSTQLSNLGTHWSERRP